MLTLQAMCRLINPRIENTCQMRLFSTRCWIWLIEAAKCGFWRQMGSCGNRCDKPREFVFIVFSNRCSKTCKFRLITRSSKHSALSCPILKHFANQRGFHCVRSFVGSLCDMAVANIQQLREFTRFSKCGIYQLTGKV